MFESFFLRGQSTSIRSIEREADECFPTKSWPSGILPRPRSLRPASSSALYCMQAVPTEQCLESTLSTLCAPRTLHQGCISLVDCPTQLICTWIFICWVGGGYSMTKLKEHSREICYSWQELSTDPNAVINTIKLRCSCCFHRAFPDSRCYHSAESDQETYLWIQNLVITKHYSYYHFPKPFPEVGS